MKVDSKLIGKNVRVVLEGRFLRMEGGSTKWLALERTEPGASIEEYTVPEYEIQSIEVVLPALPAHWEWQEMGGKMYAVLRVTLDTEITVGIYQGDISISASACGSPANIPFEVLEAVKTYGG